MTRRRSITTLLLVFLLLTAGCQESTPDDELNGRITLWHSLTPAEALVFQGALDQFQEIHPNVSIIPLALPEDKVLKEFIAAGNAGFGPSLLIGNDSWVRELKNEGLIRPFDKTDETMLFFNARNTAIVQYDDQLLGVPLFLEPSALYYNKSMVTEPPVNLDDLLQEAAAGNQVAFVPRFEQAYWGIQAFGDGLFDNQDRFTLAESGFTEWLDWLDDAQRAPGVILNIDDDSLMELFATEQLAYIVAGSEKQEAITARIDEENPFEFGVVPLPHGPQGSAGPLLPAETILLYAFASAEQARVADALATFLVNQQQSIRFMREMERLPANPDIRVDKRVYPIVNGFAQQALTAVVIPHEVQTGALIAAGDRAYVTALSGELTAAEAVCQFGQEVAAFQGYSAADMSLPQGCELPPN